MTTENKNTPQHKTNYVRKAARIILKIVLFAFLLVIVLFLLILTPPVQRFATTKVESYLQNKLKTKVEIGSISFGLTGRINLKDIYIEDQTKDTLLSGGLIKANVSLMKLFSNEVEVKDLALEDITAKIKRILPDTAFNFQFIADAFMTENTKSPDTAQTAPLKLNVYTLKLDNINLVYKDVLTGNDMAFHIGDLQAKIDTLNPYESHFSVPSIQASNVVARMKQFKPLVEPKPMAQDMAEAAEPITMKLSFGDIDLSKIDVQYANDVSAFYTQLNVGELKTTGKAFDLQHNLLHLGQLALNNTTAAIQMGNKKQAEDIKKAAAQNVEAQSQNNWNIRVDDIQLNNNHILFDDSSKPKQTYGIDYAHMNADSITLHLKDFVMNSDSIGTSVTQGHFKEKSGFTLQALEGDILYASKQTYLKDFLIKTPGTELKRSLVLNYSSYKALTDSFQHTQMDIDIPNAYVQVKDILAFAPQLRSQPAFARPNEVWHINIQASGNMERLHVAALQFRGLKNTTIDASGTLASMTNPNQAGGTFTIKRLHTTKSDIALLSGQALPPQINLPESIDIRGTLAGNAANLRTNLTVASSAGVIDVEGTFSNLTDPNKAKYNALIKTNGLQLGYILKDQATYGSLSAALNVSGQGFTPDRINTTFKGNVYSFGYNQYTYRNVFLEGSMHRSAVDLHVNSKDPNAYMNLTAKGKLTDNPSFKINGFIDSLKTQPLHFTTQPMVFRGQIDADIPNANPDKLQADVLITKALLVSGADRLPLDTIHVMAGRNDTAQYIRLQSDIANAAITGQYRLTDLAGIIQNNIQPYFSVAPYQKVANIQPYDFSFTADVIYSPILSGFMPGLKNFETIHANGRLATGEGLQANVSAPFINFSGNEISNLNMKVHTGDSLFVTGTLDRLKSGNSFDLYNTQLNATALNNVINFNMRVGDKSNRDKYYLAGVLTQPSEGNYSLTLKPDRLLLNYEPWSVTPDNSLAFINNQIIANNFTLQKDNQRLTLQSGAGTGDRPLDVSFNNFRLSTITGFIKADSLVVDGVMNGNVELRNLMQQPVFTSDLTINDLSMKKDTLGNINLKVTSSGNKYLTNATITGKGNDIALTGSFTQEANDILLDLDLAIRQLQLNTLEGPLSGFLTSASGTLTGNVKVNGTASQPKVNGVINFDTTSFNTVMLGGPFKINDEKLNVTEKGFVFDNFSIRDSANNALTLNGNVETTNFINYAFSLDIDADNFKALSTKKKPNQIYYGDLFISTNLHVSGTEQSPVIDGTVTINKNTDLSVVIPQAEPGVQQREGIVEFIDFDAPGNDSLFLAYDSLNKSKLIGFDINTNLVIDKGANFNVIVDEANGDFLNMKGTGELTTAIDPSGKITLTGTYQIDEGAYQLSFNFLQRKFEIEKGSKITWLGDPTSAQIDVTAIYIANTAPLDLVEDQIQDSRRNYYLQKLPFQVQLKLTGELMKPQIAFNILLPEDKNYNVANDIVSTVNLKLTQLRQEPSELNKQVFAILLLNRFVGENPFASSGGGGFNAGSFARQSVSKLLTEQLNQLAAGLIDGVDLNFDVASSDDYTTGERRNRTDLNVGLSKRLLNDRLTVTVGSNFELEGPQQSNQRSNNIAGNVSVNYQLSKDGRYMLRFYRKNDYQGVVDGYIIETGIGFIITVDYNRFSQIFQGKKKRNERTVTKPNPQNG